MAGTLVIDTLKSSTTGPTVFQNTSGTAIGTLCRAWVNFDGSTGNISGSGAGTFNVSSITVVGTGRYTVNFTNALSDANYAAVFGARNVSGNNVNGVVAEIAGAYGTAVRTTTQLGIVCMDSTSGGVNSSSISVAIFR